MSMQIESIPKKVVLGIMVALAVAGGAIWFFAKGDIALTDASKGQAGLIKLEDIKPGMTISDGSPVQGTFKANNVAAVYYTVTSEDKRVLGAGNIAPSEVGKFSRNMSISTQNYKGKKGELRVYMEDAEGKELDSVSVEVTLE